ncbi:MAG: alpha/beta fold hydrolase [Bacteroidetes bacterium]|nr:alpha/beta fold hydrolase [Bacteroidota bacterium]
MLINSNLLRVLFAALLPLWFTLGSCKEEESPSPDYRPIVAVHGYLGSGDTWAAHFKAFSARGYADDRLYAFDYNSLGDDALSLTRLDAFIDEVLAATGAEQVDLMGHSKGGGLGYTYLSDPDRAAKVAHYAHIGSFRTDSAAGPSANMPTLNIWSPDDLVISDKGDIPGAVNVNIAGADHYQIATHPDGFAALWKHFNEVAQVPAASSNSGAIRVAGKALTFGENTPLAGGTVEVWALDAQAQRLTTAAALTLTTNTDGTWGPAEMPDAAYLEFRVKGASASARAINYFRTAGAETDRWIYLRTIPPPISVAGLLLSSLPQDDNQTVLAVFSSSQAVLSERDNLDVDGFDLATPALASPDQTTIAYFLYDDGDASSSGDINPVFAGFPFLNGVDLFFPTAAPQTILLTFNGRQLPVRNLRSDTDGPIVAVFD